MWDDPRQLERWWGPPTYPATVVDHDLTPGGRVSYFMTGPEGDRHRLVEGHSRSTRRSRLEFDDGFADDAGEPNPDMPTTNIRVTLDEQPGGGHPHGDPTRRSRRSRRWSRWSTMGMEEGMTLAIGQIDEILSEDVPV